MKVLGDREGNGDTKVNGIDTKSNIDEGLPSSVTAKGAISTKLSASAWGLDRRYKFSREDVHTVYCTRARFLSQWSCCITVTAARRSSFKQ